MAEVANSWYLRGSLIYSMITSLICIPIACYFLRRIFKSQIMHFNSKCIYISYMCAVILHCVSRSMLHSIDLYHYFSSWTSACQIIPSPDRCLLRRPYKYTQYMVETSSILATIERVVSTFSNKSYEHRMKWLGILLILVHNLVAFLFIKVLTLRETEYALYYCVVSKIGMTKFDLIPEVTIFILQFITFFVASKTLTINNKYHKQFELAHSLSQRFLVKQNLRSITIFKTSCLITTVYVLLSDVAMFLSKVVFPSDNLSFNYANLELIQCVPTYYLIMAFVFAKTNRKFSQEVDPKTVACTKVYFEELQKQFDDAFIQRKRISL